MRSLVILMDSGLLRVFEGFDLVWCNQVGCEKNKNTLRSRVHIFLPTFLELVYWGKKTPSSSQHFIVTQAGYTGDEFSSG